jgi:hypothetical protein
MKKRLFCFGLGYTALALARRVRAEGFEVAGTCREAETALGLRVQGIQAWVFDTGRPLDSRIRRAS